MNFKRLFFGNNFMVKVNWLFNVTINDISVIYVAAHRCAGGLKKKLYRRSGSQCHRHFVGFFNVPVQTPSKRCIYLKNNHELALDYGPKKTCVSVFMYFNVF